MFLDSNELKRPRIIAELSQQHGGDMKLLESMVLQAKMFGADFVKVQLFSSEDLFGDNRKQHVEFTEGEFYDIFSFAKDNGIELFASVFDKKRLDWCINAGVRHLKVASRIFGTPLCEEIISTGLPTFVSNGNHPNDLRYTEPNVCYFYCIPKYPANMEDITFPEFYLTKYEGYSDHSLGLTPSIVAITKGAKYIEKHFTMSKNLQSGLYRGHLGAMDCNDLQYLRNFCNEFCQIPS